MPIGLGTAAVIGAGANLLGGILGRSGAKSANQAQIDMQYDLVKNKHKFAMEDLKRSGLNPLLSVTTPSSAGSAPKLENPNKQLGESIGAAANSAMDMKIKSQTLDNLEAENNRIKATAGYIHQQSIGQQIDNTRKGVTQPLYDAAGNVIDAIVTTGEKALNTNSAQSSKANDAKYEKVIPPVPPVTQTQTAGEPAKALSKDWLSKNVKTLYEFNKMFGRDHWAHKKPKFEPFDADYYRKMAVYRYVEYLKGR